MTKLHCLVGALSLVAAFSLGSCKSSDDDDVVLSDRCYLKSFTLGTLRIAHKGIGSQGQDSTYYTVFSGSAFPMSIDQQTLTIENRDSLPSGTRLNAVLVNISYEGVVAYRKADAKNYEDSVWHAYSATDSIDLREDLIFGVVSSDGTASKQYRVRVNVHKSAGDEMKWAAQGLLPGDALTEARKPVVVGGQPVALVQTPSGVVAYSQGDSLWEAHATNLAVADVRGTQMRADTLFMTSGAQLLFSTDALAWQTYATVPDDLRLVAASPERLYAYQGGHLVSTTRGETWQAESLDAEPALLPQENIQAVAYTDDNGFHRILLMGGAGRQWLKTWTDATSETGATWIYFTPNPADHYRLPQLPSLCVERYDGGLIAFGLGSEAAGYDALGQVFYSLDNGIAWKRHDDIEFAPALAGEAREAQTLSCVQDTEHRLWLFVDRSVWCGQLGRMAFKQ